MKKSALKMGVIGACLSLAGVLPAATNITENVTLSEDADWRDQGQVTVASGVTVDLNGHKLKVRGLTCNGAVVDSQAIAGYRRLTYIEASRQQWIDTGFAPTTSTGVDMDFTSTNDNDNRAYFCATWGDNGYMLVVNQGYFRFFGLSANLADFVQNKHYRFVTLPGEDPNVIMYDGDTGAQLGAVTKDLTNQNGYTMSIFAGNNNGTRFQLSQYRLHSFKMTDNGTLVRDLVPVVRESDGAAGLWDRVNSQFYGNSGSGEFIQGPAVKSLLLDLSDGATYSFSSACTVPMTVIDSELTQDCDLRALGEVEIAGEVALNGHKLYTAGAPGTGSIINVSGMYSHYRFKVEAIGSGSVLGFSDLRLYSYGANVTTQRSGASGSYGGGKAGGGSETFEAVLDNNVNNKWCAIQINNFNTLWVQVDYAEPIKITKYEWYSTNDGAQRDRAPTRWRFQGSNDGTNWTDIDVVERGYNDNPATSKTLAYTYDTGATQQPGSGEFHAEIPEGVTAENALAFTGNIKFVKDGAGTLTETRSAQSHQGGDEITAGTLAYAATGYAVPGNLTLAGGTLMVTDGNPLTVAGALSVTSPSTVKFICSEPIGLKPLINGAGTGYTVDDLTLVVEPSIPGTGLLSAEAGDLTAFFGGADDVALARWTGAVDGDVSKPGNWNCINGLGAQLSGRLPGEISDVRIEGNVNIQMPVGCSITYGRFILGDCTLTTDCDWRGLPGPISGTVALNGHRLILTDFLGTGTIQGNAGGYLHYRFKIEAIGSGSVLGFSDLRLYNGTVNVTGQRSGASGSNGGGNAAGNDQTFAAVLNNTCEDKWCVTGLNNFDTLWVQVDYATPMPITKYEWYSTNDGLQRERAPIKWRFQGSNDGTTWTDLDVVGRRITDNPATSKTLAYTGFVAPSSTTPDVLQVDVAEGLTKSNTALAIAGNLKVVKTGAGIFVANKAGQTYFGGTEVAEGTLQPGSNSNGLFGNGGDTLVVAEGAQILDNLAANGAFDRHHLQLEGEGPDGTGAYRVTVKKDYAYSYAWTRGLTITGDTLFGRDDYGFGLIDASYGLLPLALNGHTLTFRSPKATGQNATHLAFANVNCSGPGTLVISDYVKLYPMQVASFLPETTLVIDPLAEYWTGNDAIGVDLTVSNLVYRSSSANSQTVHTTTVYGCYTPASAASAPKVQLGDAGHLAPTLDLGSLNGALDVAFGGGLTFTENSTVLVNLGERRVTQMEKLIAWSEKPTGVTFVCGRKEGSFVLQDDGLYYTSGLMIIIR